jgi:hypothetical protein
MKKTILSMVAVVLIGGASAIAQSGNPGGSTSATAGKGGPLPAPVGHRQPRATEVPDEKNLSNPNDPMNKQDAALDRKIKSICRGC